MVVSSNICQANCGSCMSKRVAQPSRQCRRHLNAASRSTRHQMSRRSKQNSQAQAAQQGRAHGAGSADVALLHIVLSRKSTKAKCGQALRHMCRLDDTSQHRKPRACLPASRAGTYNRPNGATNACLHVDGVRGGGGQPASARHLGGKHGRGREDSRDSVSSCFASESRQPHAKPFP